MKDKVLNTYNGKEYTFSTYFVINNGKLFSTTNFNFDENLKNCFYIKKFGSNTHPVIYLDTKVDNKWINKNQVIGDYNQLMDFLVANENSYICMRGFSRAVISQIVRMTNELKGTDIKPVKFKSKLAEARYEKYLLTKEQMIEELNEKLENSGDIETAGQFMKICHSVFSKDKIKSRHKMILLKRK